MTVELVGNLAAAEANGKALYEGWAKSCQNPEAAALLRQNGNEETTHAERLRLISQHLVR